MIMQPGLRKVMLTTHVVASVGWLGTVVAFIAIAVVGLTSREAQTVRAAYLMMEPTAWFALLPLVTASLLTGVIQGLGTTWGLLQHYWVMFKLLLNAASTLALLTFMGALSLMADVAADTRTDLSVVQNSAPFLRAALALVVLIMTTVLAIYKPRGMTRYGRRQQDKQRRERRKQHPAPAP